MKTVIDKNNERYQIPSFSDIIFYCILNFTTDSIEFVSDIFKMRMNGDIGYNASNFTCDQFMDLCLRFIPAEGKPSLMRSFSRKNALTQYGKEVHSIVQEITLWPTHKKKIKARALMNIERDNFSGAIKGYFYIFETGSIMKSPAKSSKELHIESNHSSYTGRMHVNKKRFDSFLEAVIKNQDKDYALVYMDIANFEEIKSILKYEDSLNIVSTVAEIVKSNLKENERCCNAYFSSLFLLMEYETQEKLEARLKQINTVIHSLKQTTGGTKISARLSYGITLVKAGELNDASLLTKQAVVAHGHNNKKRYGDFSYTYFNEEMQKKLMHEKYIETNMMEALRSGKFDIYLQPKFEIATNKITGAEALARWHDNGVVIPPQEFIPLFEANSSIIELDLYIFETVCSLLRKWINEAKSPIPISVNISKVHLHKKDFFRKYRKILAKYDIPPEYIELEITESILTENPDILKTAIAEIHNIGMRCSLDDFGSGYSSLNMIKEIEVDSIKIDRAFFLYSSSQENKAKKVIESIVNIAKELSMNIVAEGVETEEQITFLEKTGCNIVQCFLTSKPLDVDTFEKKYFPEDEFF